MAGGGYYAHEDVTIQDLRERYTVVAKRLEA